MEIQCKIPKDMFWQKLTYSTYKSQNTLKVLIGISPNGALTYCSDLYPGSISDKAIVEHCGLLNLLKVGDIILADKGFTISDLLPQGISLNIPPFLSSSQFTPAQYDETRWIAKARIHIEQIINCLKRYKILNAIPLSLFMKSSMITKICASLVNFETAILKESEEYFVKRDTEENN